MTKEEKKKYKTELKRLNERVDKYKEYIEENYIEVDAKEVMNKNTINDAIDGMEEDNKYIPYKYDLDIYVTNCPLDQEEIVKNKIEQQIVARLYEIKLALRIFYKKIILLFVLGLIFLGISVYLHYIEFDVFVLQEIASIGSWVFMWTTVEKLFFDRHELKRKQNMIERLFFSKYIFMEGKDI